MQLREFFILLLIFALIGIGVNNFIGDIANRYEIKAQNITALDVAQNISQETQKLKENVQQFKTGISIIDIPFMVVSGAITVLKLILQDIPKFWSSFITDVSKILGIPAWATNIVMAIIGVIVVFEVMSAVLKYRV